MKKELGRSERCEVSEDTNWEGESAHTDSIGKGKRNELEHRQFELESEPFELEQ